MTLLSAGAALGVGAFAVPIAGTVLAKPIVGEDVPTRITDLLSYATARRAEDDFQITGSSGGLVDRVNAAIDGAVASPTVPAPERVPVVGEIRGGANTEQKRMLAFASLAAGLLIAGVSFVVFRKVLQ